MISACNENADDVEVTFDPNMSIESADLEHDIDAATSQMPSESKVSKVND